MTPSFWARCAKRQGSSAHGIELLVPLMPLMRDPRGLLRRLPRLDQLDQHRDERDAIRNVAARLGRDALTLVAAATDDDTKKKTLFFPGVRGTDKRRQGSQARSARAAG
jgi:hypothetical protein